MTETRRLGALLLAAGAVCAVWALGDRDSHDEHVVNDKISEVRLDSPNGDITIRVGDDDRTTIKEKRSYFLVNGGDAYKVDGGTLRLTDDCGWRCHVDFEVTVPRGTKVTGENNSGDLSIAGVSGIDAKSRSGSIKLENIAGDTKLNLLSGNVSIDGLTGSLDFDGTSGDLKAEHLKGGPVHAKNVSGDLEVSVDEATDVEAQGTSGDIHVEAPAGGYQIRTGTRSGDVDNGLTNDPAAAHHITATTVSGDVEVRSN